MVFLETNHFTECDIFRQNWEFVLVTPVIGFVWMKQRYKKQLNTKQNLHMKLNTGGCYLKVCLETRREIESEVGNDRVKNLGEVKGVIGVGRQVQYKVKLQ